MPKHLVHSYDWSKQEYEEILRRFNKFVKKGIPNNLLKGKVVATLMFQPSTRTMNMFQAGMIKAGGGWIGVNNQDAISMGKGESLEDTIMEYCSFADCIVLRHPDDDSAERAASAATVPFINGGSGSSDLGMAGASMLCNLSYFFKRPFENVKVGLYGTPEINRLIKSFIPILGMFGANLVIDDLGYFPLPKEIEEKALANGLKSLKYDKLDNFIEDVDILLVTRGLQKGIIPEGKFPKEKEEMVMKRFRPINKDDMKRLKKDAILYMIKPRIFEVEKDVDSDPRAVYARPEPFNEIAVALMSYVLGANV